MKNSITPTDSPKQQSSEANSQTKAPWTWETILFGLKIGTVITIIFPVLLYTWASGTPINSWVIIAMLVASALLVVGAVMAMVNIVMLILFFILRRRSGFKTGMTALLILLTSMLYLGWIIYMSYVHTT